MIAPRLLGGETLNSQGTFRVSEQIMKLNKSVRDSLDGIEASAPKPIPVLFACCFLLYLVTAFFLMAAVRAGENSPEFASVLAKFHIPAAHTTFFRYSVIGCALVPAILLIEWVCVGWGRSSLNSMLRNRSLSGRSDFICFLLTHFRLLRLPQVLFTFGFAMISGSMVSELVWHRLFPGAAGLAIPAMLAYPLYFFLYTFFDYIAHRVDHSRYFWPLHRFHHAAEDFNVFTADRGHPASAFTQSGLKIFPLALLGVPPEAVIDIGMLIVAINYLNHSRITWDFGWFGRWIIQSPLHHQLHHSRALRRPTNLSICPLWDRLGGTWLDVRTSEITIGTSVPYRHGAFVVPDMLRDYRDFLRGLWRGTKRLCNDIARKWHQPAAQGAVGPGGETIGAAEASVERRVEIGGAPIGG